MKKIIDLIKFTSWKPIRYCWPYPEGYGICRKNRFTGMRTVVDRYETKQEALDACVIENKLN